MPRILVLYYSSYGHVRRLAEAEAKGARSVPGAKVDIRRVPETVPEAVRTSAGYVDDDTPVAAPADMAAYDAIIFGTPTRFGLMAAQMKQFFDMAGGLWAANALVGKVGAVFTSTGSRHGGHEATLLTTQVPLQHFGMTVVGLPYSFAGQTTREAIIGGAPYGAGTIGGGGRRAPADRNRPCRCSFPGGACRADRRRDCQCRYGDGGSLMTPRPTFFRRAPLLSIRHRMMAHTIPRDLSPRLIRDIGLDRLPEHPHIPPFAALVTRV